MPRSPALAAGALVLLALAATAHAQVAQPQVAVTLEEDALRLDADGTATVNATVRYTDPVPAAQGTVTLAAVAPDGWTVAIEPAASFPLNAGGSQTVTLRLTAPAAGTGAEAADATLTATVDAGPGRTATGSATLGLARLDPLPPPPPDNTPLLLAGVAAALLVLGLAAAVLVARRRRLARLAAERDAAARAAAARAAFLARETGIRIAPAGEAQPFGDRREVAVRLRVHNASDRPRVALVEVKDATAGWLAAVNVPRRELRSGEDMVVTLTARPPDGAPLGATATVVVAARPEEAREMDERVTLDLRAPDARSSGAPPLAHRDGVLPKRLRR